STGKMRVAATMGIDSTGTEDIGNVRDRMVAVRMTMEEKLASNIRGRAGVDVLLDSFDLSTQDARTVPGGTTDSQTSALYPPRDELVAGMYGDLVWRVTPRVEIIP